jgi:hypothetical protein
MGAPPATRAAPSRSMPAGGSRRYLAGSRRSLPRRGSSGADCASSSCAALRR